MSVHYELLDTATGMLLKEYETESEARDDLREFGREHGADHLQGLALLRVSDDRPALIAMSEDLITLVYSERHSRPEWTARSSA